MHVVFCVFFFCSPLTFPGNLDILLTCKRRTSSPFPICGILVQGPLYGSPTPCTLVLGCNHWLAICKRPSTPTLMANPRETSYCPQAKARTFVSLKPREQAPPTKVLFSHWAMRGSPAISHFGTFPGKLDISFTRDTDQAPLLLSN